MEPLTDKEFRLGQASLEDVLEALSERFRLAAEPAAESHLTFWDTFDWRLWDAGGVLIERPAPPGLAESGRELAWCDPGGALRRLVRLDSETRPGMAADLPPELEELAPLIDIRRLLPRVHVNEEGPRLRLLDDKEKTVVRLAGVRGQASRDAESPGHPMPPRLRVEPLRGYADQEREVLRFLADRFQLPPSAGTPLETALEVLGRRPGDYSSKVRLELDTAHSALEAACAIHRDLLDKMLVNEPGLRRDLDSEFLHDFRVAVRRTRSALSQIKDVFADDVAEHFKHQFRWLGQLTGPTRDLDVYLLKMPSYRAELPAAARRDLEPLADFLAARQKREHARLVAGLDSPRYRDLLETWRRQLDTPSPGPAAEVPAVQVASARLWKLYRRLVKRGREIGDDTPAEALHDVRILGKKLRYTLEFFRSLYPTDEIDRSIKELKRLQDNLGDFNDFEVQQRALGRFASELQGEMAEAGRSSAATLLAVGRLQAELDEGWHRERRRFHRRFERFASGSNRDRFRHLFAP